MKTQISLPVLLLILLISCKTDSTQKQSLYTLSGETMGTTYMVKYIGTTSDQSKAQIDSLLLAINESVSTYIPTSTISQINQANANTPITIDEHFVNNFKLATQINKQSYRYFNPAIMPLVNYWGFGFDNAETNKVDSAVVKEIHAICNFTNFDLEGNQLTKSNPKSQLDFSAIAKGYGVDQVANLLISNDIENFLVEIGGEGYAQGYKQDGKAWTFGIRKPEVTNKTTYLKAITIHKKGIATSGNYENYRELEDKQVIAHTINPKTGFAQSLHESLLSTSVIAPNCATADAYATAFKAMGYKNAITIAKEYPELEVFFIYKNEQGEIETFSTLKEE